MGKVLNSYAITFIFPNTKIYREVHYTYYEKLKIDQLNLEEQISYLKQQILSSIPGELRIWRNGSYCKFYCQTGTSTTYISRKDQSTIEQLARKKYLSAKLEDLTKENAILQKALLALEKHPSKSEALLSSDSAFCDVLISSYSSFDEAVQKWLALPFESNPYYPDQLKYKSVSGNMVRSKSELLIDAALFTHHIPFHYECALTLGGSTYYPDFTILHPVTGELVYWEHFGLMDDLSYRHSAAHKVQRYIEHGIFPSGKLITTYESNTTPFTPQIVEKTIAQYFPAI